MPTSLRKFSQDRKIDPNRERPIQYPYCPQSYLLVWDDEEWTSVKDWIRVAEAAVRRSHRLHGDIELPSTLKTLPNHSLRHNLVAFTRRSLNEETFAPSSRTDMLCGFLLGVERRFGKRTLILSRLESF